MHRRQYNDRKVNREGVEEQGSIKCMEFFSVLPHQYQEHSRAYLLLIQAKKHSLKTLLTYENESHHFFNIYRSKNITITSKLWRRWQAQNIPLVDQRPFHICTYAEYLHPAVVIYQDERKEWLSCKLSLQQQKLWLLLKVLAANHCQAQGSVNEKKLVTRAWV